MAVDGLFREGRINFVLHVGDTCPGSREEGHSESDEAAHDHGE